MSTPVRFLLPAQIYEQMLDQARSEYPNECCGILAGKEAPSLARQAPMPSLARQAPMAEDGLKPEAQAKASKPEAQAKALAICRIERCYPAANTLASPTEYYLDGKTLLHASKDARRHGLDIIGFYHSHPSSAPIPSETDRRRNYWGETVIHFIISLATDPPEVRGWHVTEEKHWEAEWEM